MLARRDRMTTFVVRARTCEHAHVCVRRDWSDRPTRSFAACSGAERRQVEPTGFGRKAVPSRAPSGVRQVATVVRRASAPETARLRPGGRQSRAGGLASSGQIGLVPIRSVASEIAVFGLRPRSSARSSGRSSRAHRRRGQSAGLTGQRGVVLHAAGPSGGRSRHPAPVGR